MKQEKFSYNLYTRIFICFEWGAKSERGADADG